MNTRSKLTTFCITLCFLITAAGCSKKIDNSNNAATINGKVITKQALERETSRVRDRFINSNKHKQQGKNIEKEILEIMIGGELLYQASQYANITVPASEIQTDLVKTNKQYADKDNFKNTFTADEINRKLSIEKFITQEFADTTNITDEDGEKFYNENLDDFTSPEQVIASHILIKVKDDATDAEKQSALDKIKEIKIKIKHGVNFADLAKEFSEDNKADLGGILGVVIRGQMVKSFEEAAFALNPGEVSDIVKTEFGYHLITISDKKPTIVIPYAEIKDKLKSYLRQREINSKIENFLKEKRTQATIEIYL